MAGKTDYKNQYAAEKYDNLRIIVPKGGKELIKKAAEQSGTGSINGYVTSAVNEKLIKDGFKPIQKQENKEVSQWVTRTES